MATPTPIGPERAHTSVTIDGGVATVRLHSAGAPLDDPNVGERDLLATLVALESDPQVRVAVLTGTRGEFALAQSSPVALDAAWAGRRTRALLDFVDLRMPLIAAVEGRAEALAEYALLCDLVVVDPAASFRDDRLNRLGIPPIDGAHAAWSLAAGPLRARHHLLTGEPMSAAPALACGAANAMSPTGGALALAQAQARRMADRPRLSARYAREALVQARRRLLQQAVPLGLSALLGREAADAPDGAPPAAYDPDRYDQVRLSRDADGVVTLLMHDGRGGPWRFRSSAFRDIHLAFAEVANDPAARALLITSPGDAFGADGDLAEVLPVLGHLTPESFDYFFRNGGRTLFRQFHVDVPVVLALNGPAHIHAEFFFAADLVVAAESFALADMNHLSAGNAIGASGIAWEHLAGPAGIVGELVTRDALMATARARAMQLARLPRATQRAIRTVFGADQRLAHALDYSPGAGLLALSLLGRTTPPTAADPYREPGERTAA